MDTLSYSDKTEALNVITATLKACVVTRVKKCTNEIGLQASLVAEETTNAEILTL